MKGYPTYKAADGGILVITTVRKHTVEGMCFHEETKQYHPLGTTPKDEFRLSESVGQMTREQFIIQMADYDGLQGALRTERER